MKEKVENGCLESDVSICGAATCLLCGSISATHPLPLLSLLPFLFFSFSFSRAHTPATNKKKKLSAQIIILAEPHHHHHNHLSLLYFLLFARHHPSLLHRARSSRRKSEAAASHGYAGSGKDVEEGARAHQGGWILRIEVRNLSPRIGFWLGFMVHILRVLILC